eukprot:Gregarina_sp_Poly_1__741@NODE_1177_length_4857_cov_483_461587_g807_i0_p1_GENE_NODE_1177_length_4857_cov_483_461587_g807_i0NODE_1177_length_4857_cov_483_461587_g807_i0_p1_ORF_typecomplete_len367_score18_98MENTAL/PF10457_9/0_022_NODE_1177_length_4857_cov_483_461587_g807_i04401540
MARSVQVKLWLMGDYLAIVINRRRISIRDVWERSLINLWITSPAQYFSLLERYRLAASILKEKMQKIDSASDCQISVSILTTTEQQEHKATSAKAFKQHKLKFQSHTTVNLFDTYFISFFRCLLLVCVGMSRFETWVYWPATKKISMASRPGYGELINSFYSRMQGDHVLTQSDFYVLWKAFKKNKNPHTAAFKDVIRIWDDWALILNTALCLKPEVWCLCSLGTPVDPFIQRTMKDIRQVSLEYILGTRNLADFLSPILFEPRKPKSQISTQQDRGSDSWSQQDSGSDSWSHLEEYYSIAPMLEEWNAIALPSPRVKRDYWSRYFNAQEYKGDIKQELISNGYVNVPFPWHKNVAYRKSIRRRQK